MQLFKKSLSFRLAFLTLFSTGLIFCIAYTYNYYRAKELILKNVQENTKNLTYSIIGRAETILQGAQKTPTFLAQLIEQQHPSEKQLLANLQMQFASDPNLFGSTAAFEANSFHTNQKFYSPYYYRDENEIKFKWLGASDYHYFSMDWYAEPIRQNKSIWTEPYFDEGGGNVIMSTFSVPFYHIVNGKREPWGVVTADMALPWFEKLINQIRIFQTGYAFVLSPKGAFIAHPNKSYLLKHTIFSVADEIKAPELKVLGNEMLSHKEGYMTLPKTSTGKSAFVYYATIPSTQWAIGIAVHEDELYAEINQLGRNILLIGILGFSLLLIFIMWISTSITRPIKQLAQLTSQIAKGKLDIKLPEPKTHDEVGELSRSFENMRISLKEYINNLTETTKAKERYESELKIARTIQSNFLPKKFPPHPMPQFEISTHLTPALEVGGDLYDCFFIDDDRLFFAIGDTAGKGVPAALFMAVTKTLMKGIAEDGIDPGAALSQVNRELCIDNDQMLFVTVFCGTLNYKTGEMHFANAGHNPPLLIGQDGKIVWLATKPAIALGINEMAQYKSESLHLKHTEHLICYTDGVTEATDAKNELYGNDRLYNLVTENKLLSAKELNEKIFQSILEFQGDAPQADDITVLTLKLL